MKTLAVIPSIRDNGNMAKFADNFKKCRHDVDILIVDEGGKRASDIEALWFGPAERDLWFKNQGLGDVDNLIPKKAHNENSFGLLYALKQDCYDMILFLDDDTRPTNLEVDFIGHHWQVLNKTEVPQKFHLGTSWVNTYPFHYSRGYPYSERTKVMHSRHHGISHMIVLNMGLWTGIADLNAVDYLTTKGTSPLEHYSLERFALPDSFYAPICSMNVAFKPEIIPAYYQLWFNDRYDDIFSGLFLEKIAGHLKKSISIGTPLVYHAKEPRNIFDDIRRELPSMELNEFLWKILNKIELTETTWLTCYRELAEKLLVNFREPSRFSEYIAVTTSKMMLWTETCEKLMA